MSSTEARPREGTRTSALSSRLRAAAPGPQPRTPPAKATRRARLVLSRVDPWSVMKLAALLSVALGIVLVVSVAVLWGVLDGMGVFDSLTKTVADVTKNNNDAGTDLTAWFSLNRVLQLAAAVAVVDAILITALSTLTAFIYNISAAVVGGLHVTLTEDG